MFWPRLSFAIRFEFSKCSASRTEFIYKDDKDKRISSVGLSVANTFSKRDSNQTVTPIVTVGYK